MAPGGANPAFNELKRSTLAYEKHRNGHSQIIYKDLGGAETVISDRGGSVGDGDSSDPVIGNSGYYVTFESEAANLGLNALGSPGDSNGIADAYLYTDVRNLTLVQSVEEKAVPLPGGGQNPSMSYYANYVLFDSPAPLGMGGERQPGLHALPRPGLAAPPARRPPRARGSSRSVIGSTTRIASSAPASASSEQVRRDPPRRPRDRRDVGSGALSRSRPSSATSTHALRSISSGARPAARAAALIRSRTARRSPRRCCRSRPTTCSTRPRAAA